MNKIEKILNFTNLFWQYPVITEKTFFEQNKYNKNYIGIPWATIIDKIERKDKILNLIRLSCDMNIEYFTCCQHISFRKLIQFFKIINVKILYTPHKIKNEDIIDGIKIVACPLYAVNIEDPSRNTVFQTVDFKNVNRKYLYSFMGGYHPKWYLTDVRKRIFEMKQTNECIIKNTGQWHFEKLVYSDLQCHKQEVDNSSEHKINTEEYNNLLLNSRYSLCPSGSGPNSIRLWESLACGSIPIILSDTLELPPHNLWDKAIISLNESELYKIPSILSNISLEDEKKMRNYCIEIYNSFKNNFRNRKKKLLFFSNCHSEKYIQIMERDTNITDIFDTKHIVRYQNLYNFDEHKNDFMDADILIINKIKKYDSYALSNLKKYLKTDCLVIIAPFIRFEGYWMPEKYKKLQYVGDNSVSFFPDINTKKDVDVYLSQTVNEHMLIKHFNDSLTKLQSIDEESDIKFYDFFKENHLKYPFFRDNLHPTMNLYEYIGNKIILKIKDEYNIQYNENNYKLQSCTCEYGHYKPILDDVKKKLNIQYDLDKIFICSRKQYIDTVLDAELKQDNIKDLDDFRSKYF